MQESAAFYHNYSVKIKPLLRPTLPVNEVPHVCIGMILSEALQYTR